MLATPMRVYRDEGLGRSVSGSQIAVMISRDLGLKDLGLGLEVCGPGAGLTILVFGSL